MVTLLVLLHLLVNSSSSSWFEILVIHNVVLDLVQMTTMAYHFRIVTTDHTHHH